MGMPGTLYVVATPIGNLEDLTYRAARVLGEVALVVAEDTRQTRKLLTHLGLHKPLLSYNQHNAAQRTPRVLDALGAGDVALVSDAGTPLVSDPGAGLVRAAAEAGSPVVALPGPSAVVAALATAGMPADAFHFLGFPPRASKARRETFAAYAHDPLTLVVFEAPHRLSATLADLREALGDREVVVCRELTKRYEEAFRGSLSAAAAHFIAPRGEFVLVIAGGEPERPVADTAGATEALSRMKAAGLSRKDASARVEEGYGISRREAYRIWLEASTAC